MAPRVMGEVKGLRKVSRDRPTGNVVENYKSWHAKAPDTVFGSNYDFPNKVELLGKAIDIIYYADKWEKDGKGFEYIHTFDSKPLVYAKRSYLTGKAAASQQKSVCELLQVKSLSVDLDLPVLAIAKELTIERDSDHHRQTLLFKRSKPVMSCSHDRKTLIIFAYGDDGKEAPIFIRGGTMIVTERGIVR